MLNRTQLAKTNKWKYLLTRQIPRCQISRILFPWCCHQKARIQGDKHGLVKSRFQSSEMSQAITSIGYSLNFPHDPRLDDEYFGIFCQNTNLWMSTTCLSAGEEVFVLRFAGEAVMVEFAPLLTFAPLKVATSSLTPLHLILCAQICTWQQILQRAHFYQTGSVSGSWHPIIRISISAGVKVCSYMIAGKGATSLDP